MNLQDNNLDKQIKIPQRKETKILTTEEKKKRKKRTIILLITIFTLVFSTLGFLVYKGYIFSKELGFKFNAGSFLSSEQYELKTESSGNFTNVLLVGIDTRETGTLLNTDTIIMASYNHQTGDILMISIPRDFHTEIAEDVYWFTRINSVYSNAEQKEEGRGLDELQKTVERVTGQEIQYYAMIDFRAFVEMIDAVGGIVVNVENSFTDYMYPLGNQYKTVSFEAGPQEMDGETALEYARSRHSAHNNEGSDFARAKRQQKVIIALKEKILSSESLSNPKTVMNLMASVAGNVKISEFTIQDIEAVFALAKKHTENGSKTYSFVLDPTVGNYKLVERKPMTDGAYAIGPSLGFGKYEDIIEYMEIIKKEPALYSEKAKILVYDTGLGFVYAREKTQKIYEEYPYLDITFSGTIYSDKEGTAVFNNYEDSNFPYTIKKLSGILDTNLNEKPEYITTNLNGEDVTILLGKQIDLTEEQ